MRWQIDMYAVVVARTAPFTKLMLPTPPGRCSCWRRMSSAHLSGMTHHVIMSPVAMLHTCPSLPCPPPDLGYMRPVCG